MDIGPKLPMSSETPVPESMSSESLNSLRSDEDIEQFYEIQSCSKWILNGKYGSVALQFPDNLLCDSARVSDLLEREIGYKPFILADTSYGSCCVDQVAAQHVNAECMIHFGDACMSATEDRIPVKYIFPHLPFDEIDFQCQLSKESTNFDCNGEVLTIDLITDVTMHHVHTKIVDIIRKTLKLEKLVTTDLAVDPENVRSLEDNDNIAILFVGHTKISPRLALLMLKYPNRQFFTFDPTSKTLQKEIANVDYTNRILKRRLFLIEKARDARIVGLVIGALSVSGYLDILERLKNLCREAGKKFIVISVGKINVAKLSNFADAVDIFVWISCPFNIMLNTSDYPHPVLTPFELEVACTRRWFSWFPNVTWPTDFKFLIEGGVDKIIAKDSDGSDTDISLITGRLRLRGPIANDANTQPTVDSLIPRSDALQLQEISVESRFAEKTWRGLEEKLGETEVKDVKEGRRGIASGYDDEVK